MEACVVEADLQSAVSAIGQSSRVIGFMHPLLVPESGNPGIIFMPKWVGHGRGGHC